MEEIAAVSRPHGTALTHCDERGRKVYRYIAGELLVADEDVDRLAALLAAEGAERVRAIFGMTLFRIARGGDIPRVIARLRRSGGNPTVSPNHVLTPALHDWWGAAPPAPAEPLPRLPNGDNLAGSGVVIGALDTGLEPHSWFQGRARRAHAGLVDRDELDESQDGVLDREAGHGTHVAGILLQHAPGAQVVAWAVRDVEGRLDDASANEGIVGLVRDHNVDILNITFAGAGGEIGNPAMERALEEARRIKPDLVVVAAAGNRETHHGSTVATGDDAPQFPAASEGVISVGAVDDNDVVADFSHRGDWIRSWSLGTSIRSTYVSWNGPVTVSSPHADQRQTAEKEFRGFASWSGTSFATPRVAGAIAGAMSPEGQAKRSAQDALRLLGLDAQSLSNGGPAPILKPTNFVTG
jgi:subtilisin family serine protease